MTRREIAVERQRWGSHPFFFMESPINAGYKMCDARVMLSAKNLKNNAFFLDKKWGKCYNSR